MEPDRHPTLDPLTPAERRDLLRLAREAIAAVLQGQPSPPLPPSTPSLSECSGVFVSLHASGQLRGCVGTLAADHPLHESVARMAVVAAFEDPRFPPLTEAELIDTEIEISRLSVPTPTTPENVVVGRHGVCIVRDDRRAVLLPQVAELHGWDCVRLLEELCRKAFLPPDDWRQPDCQLLCFEAEVFGDGGKASDPDS